MNNKERLAQANNIIASPTVTIETQLYFINYYRHFLLQVMRGYSEEYYDEYETRIQEAFDMLQQKVDLFLKSEATLEVKLKKIRKWKDMASDLWTESGAYIKVKSYFEILENSMVKPIDEAVEELMEMDRYGSAAEYLRLNPHMVVEFCRRIHEFDKPNDPEGTVHLTLLIEELVS